MNLRRNFRRVAAGLALCLLAASPAFAVAERKVTQLAAGVYAIQHADHDDGFASGNTTVIIGSRQIFVVDSGFSPSEIREDIAQIRQWSNKPVSFLLNTHFHNDHNFANRVYMDAFPALTIIAHAETKRDMEIAGNTTASRVAESSARLQKMLDTGKTPQGQALSNEDKAAVRNALAQRGPVLKELQNFEFQNATLTFEHGFTVDLGDREVEVKYLGRGNTAGDAVVYLPREKIIVAGDLVVHPIPFFYDGYPAEWARTLDRLAALDAQIIVPGHGPVLRDKAYVYLARDFIRSAVEQLQRKLRQKGPALSQKLEDISLGVDLTAFRQRFAGNDKDRIAEFDDAAARLVKLAFQEASVR